MYCAWGILLVFRFLAGSGLAGLAALDKIPQFLVGEPLVLALLAAGGGGCEIGSYLSQAILHSRSLLWAFKSFGFRFCAALRPDFWAAQYCRRRRSCRRGWRICGSRRRGLRKAGQSAERKYCGGYQKMFHFMPSFGS
jgi:hypothetical protein